MTQEMKKEILCVIGTRPEAIKMAPLIKLLEQEKKFSVKILLTGQHRDLLYQALDIFKISADLDFNVMSPGQNLCEISGRLLLNFGNFFNQRRPSAVIAQGDTTSVLMAAISSFHQKIPFGHLEAGLRTFDFQNPFPEEMNRVLVSRLSKWHFCPSEKSKQNLLLEGVNEKNIFVTGNTVVDAINYVKNIPSKIPFQIEPSKRIILVTLHRREIFGDPVIQILNALINIANHNPDLHFIFPVHPNPNIRDPVYKYLDSHPSFTLSKPLDYVSLIALMKASYFIMTDSGGIQEEAPSIGKPLLVVRDETERPEGLDSGVARLVGTKRENIQRQVQILLDDKNLYESMIKTVSPYGDGMAAKRIVCVLNNYFN